MTWAEIKSGPLNQLSHPSALICWYITNYLTTMWLKIATFNYLLGFCWLNKAQLHDSSTGLTWGNSRGCGQMVARISALGGMTGKLGSAGMVWWIDAFLFLFSFSFERERATVGVRSRGRERQTERERIPYGASHMTLRSWPEPKSRVGFQESLNQLSRPGASKTALLLYVFSEALLLFVAFLQGFSTWSVSIRLAELLTQWLNRSQKCVRRSYSVFLRLSSKTRIVSLLPHSVGWSQPQGQPSIQCGSRLHKGINIGGLLIFGGCFWKLSQ